MIYLRVQSEKKKQNTKIPLIRWDFSWICLCYYLIYIYDETMNTFLIILAVVLIIWILGTLLVVRGIEEPSYIILEKRDGYEIREYSRYIVAEVEVE